jgi:hypothetical protein
MNQDNLRFDGPGRYLILLKEHVSQEILSLFPIRGAQDDPVGRYKNRNQLIIDIKDQSELMGLLNALYNNHCTIIKVEHLTTVSD